MTSLEDMRRQLRERFEILKKRNPEKNLTYPEQVVWIARFEGFLERSVKNLAEELLKDVDEESIRKYFADFRLADFIIEQVRREGK